MTDHDNSAPRVRLGPRALAMMLNEAGDEKPTGSHLESAIAELQGARPATAMLAQISESILRLRSMIMASVLTDQGEVDLAMQQLHNAIGKNLVDAAKDSGLNGEKLSEVDAQLMQRIDHSFLPAKTKQAEIEDRER